jgi:hypothetical protein
MRHFQLISEGIDVAPILAEMADCADLWDAHTARKNGEGSPHKQMSDLWLRFNSVGPFERGERPWSEFSAEHTPINYPAWYRLPTLRKAIFDLMHMVDGEALYGVIITRIAPGSGIDPHRDDSFHVQLTEKFYLSLQSEPGARFHCIEPDGAVESLQPKPGEWWLFDNRKTHAVTNRSGADRITAIACIRTEKFGRRYEEQR